MSQQENLVHTQLNSDIICPLQILKEPHKNIFMHKHAHLKKLNLVDV